MCGALMYRIRYFFIEIESSPSCWNFLYEFYCLFSFPQASLFLSLVLISLLLLLQPDITSSAPVPAPAPAPFTPGIKIGALLGAGLLVKAYLLSQALSGDKEEPSVSSSYGAPSYGAPSPSYGAPSAGYGAPSAGYGAPSYNKPSYKPSYNGR